MAKKKKDDIVFADVAVGNLDSTSIITNQPSGDLNSLLVNNNASINPSNEQINTHVEKLLQNIYNIGYEDGTKSVTKKILRINKTTGKLESFN